MKKKQVSEDDFDFFNVSSELKKVTKKQDGQKEKSSQIGQGSKEKESKSTEAKPSAENSTKAKKTESKPKRPSTQKQKRTKVDGLFEIEEVEKDPFKTVQVRTSLWKEAEKVSKKIEEKTGKKYSATKVLNRILEDYFSG